MLCMEVVCVRTKKNIAAALKKAKLESGKSMEEFAADFDLRKSTIQGYMKMDKEEYKGNPTVVSLEQIAAGLNMTVAQLVSDPDSVWQYPPECNDCLKATIQTLHPTLRHRAEIILEMLCEHSAMLYEADNEKKCL